VGTARRRRPSDQGSAGETFREFIGQLEQLGYTVEWRVLNAADFGAPTSRKRLFLIARRDGRPIAWPKPTHGPKGTQPYRTAAECIDWSIPVPSIFDRKKPLAEATQRRIAEGIRRYVLEAKRPFLVNLTHGGRVESIDDPFKTVTGAHRGEKALVAPLITKAHSHGWDRGAGPISPADRPLGTVVAKDGTAIVAPTLIQSATGERRASAARARHRSAARHDRRPRRTEARARRRVPGEALRRRRRSAVDDRPLGDDHSWDHHSHVNKSLTKFYTRVDVQQFESIEPVDGPMPTMTAQSSDAAGGHHALVAAFLAKYYGNDQHGAGLDDPMHTVTTKDRLGLVTVTIDGEEFVIADIGMRMLQPRELARAQGFPDRYILTGTKSAQVARIGNSVVAAGRSSDRRREPRW
jgi:DNA (cytosine-5)-methyltransferase 1